MKYRFLIFLVFFLSVHNAISQSLEELRQLSLPLITIETENGIEPECEYIKAPEGCWGQSITNATKVPGQMCIFYNGKQIYNSGKFLEGECGLTIKIRGNSTAYSQKKPYKLKLQNKADLISIIEEYKTPENIFNNSPVKNNEAKDKEWLLICDNHCNLNTAIALSVCNILRIDWVQRFQYVNLIFNGDYRGVYILQESVKAGEHRVPVSLQEGGFIIENDAYWWKENDYFMTSFIRKPLAYTYKDPESKSLSQTDKDYIQNCVNLMELSILKDNYQDYIDITSFAKWLLAHDILGTYDSGGSNIFLSKYNHSDTTKFQMPLLWDFDSILRTTNKWARIHNEFYFWNLFNSTNTFFTETYCNLWKNLSATFQNRIDTKITAMENSKEFADIDVSRQWDNTRWNTQNPYNSTIFNTMKEWFMNRKNWLDEKISEIHASLQIVPVLPDIQETTKFKTYTLGGIPCDETYRGPIIKKYINGKTEIVLQYNRP